MKENDYFLNLLYNPEFSPGDFLSIGLNSGNTTIRNKEDYKNLDSVKNNPLLLTNGEFDENKFNKLYEQSLVGYNLLSNSDHNERLATSYSAFRDDIFAKSANRKNLSETIITKMPNPNRLLMGFVSTNIMENPQLSIREIAQLQLVWDGETNSWVDAPNDTPINNFLNPKVLALYDEDVDINGKTASEFGFDKEHITHRKGEKKINPLTGTYYYETLNGRDIYGRDVLSGWDTLTKDDSFVNQYDFFDSDDLKKKTTGSIVKSVVKIAPALIPTIAPWYVGTRVILGASDLFAKVGKMILGSESPTLSYIEGVNKALTQSTSDWSKGSSELGIEAHAWSGENLLNLSSDVFTLLAEQRWMFTHLPSLLKGNKLGFSKEAQEKFKKETTEKIMLKYKNFGDDKLLNPFEKGIDLRFGSSQLAQYLLELKLKDANKIGEHLSKLYMTGITVADSYGEAKELGLSDTEAALFTLAYAAGEYGILNTNLGEHILPELRAEKHKYRNIKRVLEGGIKNTSEEVKNDTRKWYKKIMDFAKEAVIGDYNDAKIAAAYAANSTTKALATSVLSNALGEGLEEVSEELWYDIAKGLQNAAVDLGITLTKNKLETFDGWNLEATLNRYALNFVGGLAGGTIAVGLPGFLEGIKNMLGTNMDKKQAYLELVALIRNGKKEDFLRTVGKLETADSNLSASEYEMIDGEPVFKPGTATNNLDKANKVVLTGLVNLIDNLITTNGVKMDDNSILSKLTLAPEMARFYALIGGDEVGSATLANYLLRFNTLSTKIVDLGLQIDAIRNPKTDLKGELLETKEKNSKELSLLESDLKNLLKERDAYLNGDMAKVIIPQVIFEMSPVLSYPFITTNFKDYVLKMEGKIISDVSDTRLEELKKSWENYKNGEFKDDIEYAFLLFMAITEKFSDNLKNYDISFLRKPKDYLLNLGDLFNQARLLIIDPNNEVEDILQNTQSFELSSGLAKMTTLQKNMLALRSLMENCGLDTSALNMMMNVLEATKVEELLPADILNIKKIAESIGENFDENSFTEADVRRIKESYLKQAMYNVLMNNSEKIKEVLNNIGYFNQSTRDFLKNTFFNWIRNYDLFGTPFEGDEEELERNFQLYKEYVNIIDSKPITPIELLLDLFQLTIGDNHIKVSDLVKTLQTQMTQKANLGTIEEFGFGTDIAEQLKNAIQLIDVLASNILGARNDSGKLGAIFGFNSTVNQLNPDMKLVEIDKDSANTLMLDLAKLKTKLEYFLTIFNVNSGQKLEELKKIYNRVNYAFVKKIKAIVEAFPPDDWNKKDESGIGAYDKLMGAINKASIFKVIGEKSEDTRFNLNLELAKNLEKESIAILDALYDFFLANYDKLERGELDLSLLKILPSTSDFSKDYNGTIIDSDLTLFDDRSAIMFLATAASIKASDFYAEYKTSLVNGIAPIPGQELAVKMSYAFLLNKPMFQIFGEAYNKKLLEELNGVDSSKYWTLYGKNITDDSKFDNSYALQFINTFLIEGIPGAGKTQGVLHILYNMLNQYHKELLDEVWFIHTDELKAKAWAEKIGADPNKSKFFSKKSYLEAIYPKYVEPKTTENGVINITKEDLILDEETGIWHFKNVELNKSIKAPTLILMDESTRFSLLEMLVSEAFLKENDVSAIATGDYDLIGAVGQFDIDKERKNFLNTSNSNFFHCPKLGSSMRTENTIKDLNIAVIRKNKLLTIKKLIAGNLDAPLILLSYYLDKTGLYGERIIGKDSKDLDATITLMLNTLKGEKNEDGNWTGEKVTVIYLDKNSDIYKKLQKLATEHEEYRGKLNFVESSAAQGDEGLYYIVDLKETDIGPEEFLNNMGNHANFVNTFYTAISRSSQGTLIIENSNVRLIAETQEIKELVKSPLSDEAKLKFSKNRIDVLSEIITTEPGKTPKAKTRASSNNSSTDLQGSSEEGSDTSEELANLLNEKTVKIDNSNPKEYNMLIHSMPSNETGFIDNGSGKLIPSEGYEGRIDGLNGLTKLATMTVPGDDKTAISQYSGRWKLNADGTLTNLLEALKTLNSLALIGLYTRDKAEVKKAVHKALGLNLEDSEFGVDFLFMIRDTDPNFVEQKKKKGLLRLFKLKAEKLIGVFRGENAPKEIDLARQNKLFALNVYKVVKGKRVNILTVPLAIFTNPLTMLTTPGFEDLHKEFLKIKNDRNAPEKFLNMLLSDLELRKLPNAEKLIKHLQIFTYKNKDEDVVVYLDKTLRELATSLTGPTITVKNSKGADYFYSEEMLYRGEYTSLKDIDQNVHHLTKNIYYSDRDIIINGEVKIKKGHGFVLCSDFYRVLSDEDLFLLFVDNELNNNPEGKIVPIYVSSPKIDILDYFKNFALKYKGGNKSSDDPEIDSNIGNEVSEFRIADFITKKDSAFDKYLIDLVNSNPNNKTLTLAKWEMFKSVVQLISTDIESLNGELKTELLRKLIKDTPYINLIKYDGDNPDIKAAIEKLKHTYGDGKHSVKSFIANTLLVFILKLKNGFLDTSLSWETDGNLKITLDIQNNIQKVEESLPEKFKEGIYTQIKKKPDTEALQLGEYTFILADSENYRNKYGEFRINGKIDSTMLIMDVSPVMDTILDTIHDNTKKGDLLGWYAKDSRDHFEEAPKSTNVEDLVPASILDKFTNRSELATLISNNPKNFENCNSYSNLMETLNLLGYTQIRNEGNLTLIKLPKGYTQTILEMEYNVVQDLSGKYWLIDASGNIIKITEDWLSGKPDSELMAAISLQILNLNRGDNSVSDLASFESKLEELVTNDENREELDIILSLLTPEGEVVTLEELKGAFKDYIYNKKESSLEDGSFFTFEGYNPIESELLEQLIIEADNLGNRYDKENNCFK